MPAIQQDISPEIRGFLADLMEEAEVFITDPILKEENLQKLVERLDKLLSIRLASRLSDEQMQAFSKMNEEGKSKQEVDTYLRKNIPDVDNLFKDAFAEFRLLYVEGVKK